MGTDAEAVDRRLLGDQLFKSVFIEIAAGEDPGVFEPAFIQNGSHFLRQLNQIAAVQPHPVNRDAFLFETAGQRSEGKST